MNALNNNLARLIGPAVGGLLVAGVGFAGVVVVDAFSYLVAALLVLAVRDRADERTPPETSRHPYQRLLTEWREGLTAVQTNRLLKISFLAAAFVGFGEGFISTLMAPFVETMLGGGGPALGYIFSAQALGGIVAGLLLTGFADRVRSGQAVGLGRVAQRSRPRAYFQLSPFLPGALARASPDRPSRAALRRLGDGADDTVANRNPS